MHVIGTAGHVDHGKSTLIRALTGIDPDRLREEKERQMTIDLGFAWLDLPSGEEIGIVDVPGHRDFIDNMLAGAGGMDAVLFIIAADEGIMPQSREHLAILNLLEIKTGLIVLTKIDLIDDPEWLTLVESDVREFSANSFLAGAPILPVSATGGAGLPELISAIDAMVQTCEPKKDIGRARLPVDRVFSIKGFGTVVTGTMLDGVFSLGQQVEILPLGREARIRGLQSHKKKLDRTAPGGRTAVNLAGLGLEEIQRGDVLAEPGIYFPTNLMDVRFSMLEDATGQLKHNDHIKIFSGASQSFARVRLIKHQQIRPGGKGWLQLEMAQSMAVAKGDHFIVRRPSPAETIGGGVILDPHPREYHKRFMPAVYEHFELLETGALEDQLLAIITSRQPLRVNEIIETSGAARTPVLDELRRMLDDEVILFNNPGSNFEQNPVVHTRAAWEEKSKSLLEELGAYHREYPLRPGAPKNELKYILNWDTEILNIFLEGLLERELLKQQSGVVALPEHQVVFSDAARGQIGKILDQYQTREFSPPPLSEIRNQFGSDLVQAMISNGMLIITSDDIAFRQEDFKQMCRKLVDFISTNGGITLSQFRDLFGTSRKYALSFLEFLDKRGATSFDGEQRVIRNIDKLTM